MRSLRRDRGTAISAGLVGAMVVLAMWVIWLALGSVPVYERSTAARVEVEQSVHGVDVPIAGTVTKVHVTLGQQVQPHDLLLEIDVEARELRLTEARVEQRALQDQIEVLRDTIAVERVGLNQGRAAARSANKEARARYEEARAAAAQAATEAEELGRLGAAGHMSETELRQANARAEQERSAAEALLRSLERIQWERRQKVTAAKAHARALERELAELKGELARVTASITRLERELEDARIRAPVAGHIGELAAQPAGSVLEAGDRVASIVPSGSHVITAWFHASDAVGRIQVGQRARFRADAYSWAQYGTLGATVVQVASEPREGLIQVKLEPMETEIPIEHGLTGLMEVEVERQTPATLLLRAAGKLIEPEPDGSEVQAPASEVATAD